LLWRPFTKNLFNARLGVGVKLKQNYNCGAAVVQWCTGLLARSGNDSASFVVPNTSRLLRKSVSLWLKQFWLRFGRQFCCCWQVH